MKNIYRRKSKGRSGLEHHWRKNDAVRKQLTMEDVMDCFKERHEYSIHDSVSAHSAFRSMSKEEIMECYNVVFHGNSYGADYSNNKIKEKLMEYTGRGRKENDYDKARVIMFFLTKEVNGKFRSDVKNYMRLKEKYNL